MKRLIYSLILTLLPLTMWAQGSIWDVPVEERDTVWEAKRDSVARYYGDTEDLLPRIGMVGDVFTGYDVMPDTVGLQSYVSTYDGKRYIRYKLYHVDPLMQKVRQIVVLHEKWENFRGGIMDPDGGNKLAAVTPKEYLELLRQDLIWGEAFEICYPRGHKRDTTVSNHPGYEIVCIEKGYETLDLFDVDRYLDIMTHSKEICCFTDTIDGVEKEFVCMARNYQVGYADYTRERDYLKSKTNMTFMNKTKGDDYWMKKWLDHLKQQQLLKQRRQPLWDGSLLTNFKYKQI